MAATQKNLEAIERARTLKNVPWCEEYERMISGMSFRPWKSSELQEAQSRASRIGFEFNDTYNQHHDNVDRQTDAVFQERMRILKSLLGDFQGSPKIEKGFSVFYGCNTVIGRNFYGNCFLGIEDSALVTIGDDVIIGPYVNFITTNHSTDVAERLQGVAFVRPITVGSACWIGTRVTILGGASIGYGCTIGAGAVVTGNIPEYSVAVGVPARVVKRVFPKEPSASAAITPDVSDNQSPREEKDDMKQSPA